MADTLVIGLDLGTTTCKALAVDARARVIASASSPVKTQFSGDRAEQDPWLIADTAASVLRRLMSDLHGRPIAGLAISGAMHSLIPIGDDDQPLAPASLWSDRRAATQTAAMRATPEAHDLYNATGCGIRWLYHPPRIRWWLEQEPDIARQTRRFVALKDVVTHRLTGRWCTDTSLASTTGLLDIRTCQWHAGALRAVGIDASHLPELVSPTGEMGRVTAAGAAWSGLPIGTPVIGGGSDGPLANLGAAGAAPGLVVASIGTSGAVRMNVSQPLLDERERTWCYVMQPGRWVAGGAIANAGLALQWVKEKWFSDLSFDDMIARADAIAPGAEGVLFLPYLTGERNPHWDTDARAVVQGLTLHHTRDHLARAALEGVAFCLADVWDALRPEPSRVAGAESSMPRSALHPDSQSPIRLTGGIVRSPAWCRILCDVLGVSIEVSEHGDASAIGAARFAQVALGIIAPSQLDEPPIDERHMVFTPDAERHGRYCEACHLFRKLGSRLVFPADTM
ncbi:MAG: gluconokinase [Planctomycetes bacterium]|nr:gluconokinase [Planctomycetota bacterium]